MDTNCAPFVADVILLCHERDVILSFSDNTLADVIDAPDSTSRYLDGILNIVDLSLFWEGGQVKISTQIQMW